MTEPLLPLAEPHQRVEATVASLTLGHFGTAPVWSFVLNAKTPEPGALGEAVLAARTRSGSVYDPLVSVVDPSSHALLEVEELDRRVDGRGWLAAAIRDYGESEAYLAYFDLLVVDGPSAYRYLLPTDRFLYLRRLAGQPEGEVLLVPVVSVVRSVLAGGNRGLVDALVQAGRFLERARSLAAASGASAELGWEPELERELDIADNACFLVPGWLRLGKGEGGHGQVA